jgi:hypothetical protein
MVDTDLRRSLRIKAFNTGFKASGCGKGNWLGCELDPPIHLYKGYQKLGGEIL